MGFIVYLIWSILLHYMLIEWEKRSIFVNINKVRRLLNKDIANLRNQIVDNEKLEKEIIVLENKKNLKVFTDIRNNISKFTSGWIQFLSRDEYKRKREECLAVKKKFEIEYNLI